MEVSAQSRSSKQLSWQMGCGASAKLGTKHSLRSSSALRYEVKGEAKDGQEDVQLKSSKLHLKAFKSI